MATHNTTPFLHRYLYRDCAPQCIMSCFATSVLYANRTPANTAMVMRAIHTTVRDLIGDETARITATPIERLARTHALFLYLIIQLFDGDIALRAQGEKELPVFQTWLSDLCKTRENLGGAAQVESSLARNQSPKEWEVCVIRRCL